MILTTKGLNNMTKTEQFLNLLQSKLITYNLTWADVSRETGFSNMMFSLGSRGKTEMRPENKVIVENAVNRLVEKAKP